MSRPWRWGKCTTRRGLSGCSDEALMRLAFRGRGDADQEQPTQGLPDVSGAGPGFFRTDCNFWVDQIHRNRLEQW